jgi:dTDP-4-dehydrorhamnose 3,5-epimerase
LKFIQTKFKGVYVIEIQKNLDERGFFARTFDKKQFLELGLDVDLFQCNVSFNKKTGTLRGMHYQSSPYEEIKIVRCTQGKIFDVIIDLRSNSPTFRKWISFELSSKNHKMIYIPKGFAHGFQTLEDNTEIFYHMSDYYMPKYANGIAWNDKSVKIKWPIENPILSVNDKSYES